MYYNTTGKRDDDFFVDDISSFYISRIIINAKQKDRIFFHIFNTQIMGSQTSTPNTNTDSTSDIIVMGLYDMISSRLFLISVTMASVLFLFILQIRLYLPDDTIKLIECWYIFEISWCLYVLRLYYFHYY